jgi:hypothetical protein
MLSLATVSPLRIDPLASALRAAVMRNFKIVQPDEFERKHYNALVWACRDKPAFLVTPLQSIVTSSRGTWVASSVNVFLGNCFTERSQRQKLG